MADQTSRLVIEIDTRNTIRTINDLSTQLNNMERNGDAAGRSMNSLSSATSKLAGYMAGLVTVGSAIQKMDMYTGLNNRLKLVTNSQNELNTAMADTFAIAQRTGQAWQGVTETYQRFADNAKRLNLTQQQTAQLTETVAKSIAISGGSAESANAALLQFGQALASGTLRGEELNSVMEQAPGLAKAIAQGMGITVGELRGVAAQGKITGDVLVEALTKAKGSVDDLFGKTDFTIGQSFTLLSNAVTKFIGEAGKGSGAASTLSSAIRSLGENLSTIADIAVVGGVTALTKAILGQAVAMQASIAESTERRATLLAELQGTATATAAEVSRTAAIAELRAMQLADAQATAARMSGMARLAYVQTTVLAAERASTAATAAHTAAVEVDTVAQNANNKARSLGASAFALMGGWVGAATIAVGALAAGYMLLKDNADQATTSLDIQKQTVIDLTNEYSKMSAAKLVSEMDAVDKKIKDAQSSAESAKRSLISLVVPQSSDFITDDEIKRQSLMSDQLKKIETQGLSTAQALRALQASKLFTNDELKDAQKYFAALDDGTNSARELSYQKELANSYMQKASGFYSDNADKISTLTNESDRLSVSYSTSRENATKAAEAILQIGQNSGASATQLDKAQSALKSFSNGTMTATELAKVLQANLPIPDSIINSFIEQAKESDNFKSLMSKVNAELKTQNQLRSDFLSQHKSVLGAEQELTTEKKKQLQAEQQLNALKKTSIQKQQETQYQLNNLKASGENENTKAWNTFITKWRNDNKLTDFTKPLTEWQYALAAKEFLLEQKLSGINSKIKEDKREQTKELKKQQEILQVNAKVQAAAAKYDFAGIEAKRGLPQGTLSAIMMQESRGNANAYNSSTGAAGAFQFTPATAKRFNVDTSSVKSSAEGAGKYLAYLLQLFNGNLRKAISAYHAGEGNVQHGTGIGPINRQYQKNVLGYIAGAQGSKGSTTTDFEQYLDDQIKLKQKTEEEAKKLRESYMADDLKAQTEHEKKIADLKSHGLSSLIPQENARYEAQKKLSQTQLDYELNGYKYNEEQKLVYARDTAKLQLEASGKLNADQLAKAKAAIDEQYNYQIKARQLATASILLDAQQVLLKEQDYAKQKYDLEIENIKQTYAADKTLADQLIAYKQALYAKSLNQQFDDAKKKWDQLKVDLGITQDPNSNPFSKLQTDYQDRGKSINEGLDTKNSLTNNAAQKAIDDLKAQRDQNLIDEQDYQYQLTQIQNTAEAERTQNQADAAKMRQANDQLYKEQSVQLTLSTYSDMAGQAAQILGGMLGEQSTAYKAMFATQKAFAIATAMLSLYTNIAKASEVGFPANLAYIAAAMTQGMTIVSNVQSIAGAFAEGGLITGAGTGTSDSIPILASNKEYMIKASSVQSLGVGTLDYLNKHGELPADTKRVGSDTMTALAHGQQAQANVQAQANSANSVGNTEVKLNNINVLDPSLMGDYMSSTSGTKTMTNFIKSNRSAIKAIIG